MDQRNLQENDAIVFDTDSRAMAAEEAKNVVADVTQFLNVTYYRRMSSDI